MEGKVKKFKPFKVPRYLPGQVAYPILKSDLSEFNKHRYRVFSALPQVDDKSPPMNPLLYINTQRLTNDALRLQRIDKENKELVKKINIINRMGGKVDTFNPIAYASKSKWRAHELQMRSIVKHNKHIYKRIISAKSAYAVKDMAAFWKTVVNKMHHTCKFPLVLLEKTSLDQIIQAQPSISGEEGNLLNQQPDRSWCFMDFRVKDGVYLGRIIIELYHDYVPVTVQNFLSICCEENEYTYKNCFVHRVVPGQFLETGDITKGNGKGGTSIYGETFAEENHKLKHTKPGILSTIRVGNKVNNSQFSITFSAMPKLDDNRVVFGKVIKGNETLCKINDLGRKFGRPLAPILIHNCGKFIKGRTPTKLRKFDFIKDGI